MKRCILCLAALSLAACGASGALYLPGQEKPKSNLLSKDRKNGSAQASPAPAAPPAATDTAPAPAPEPQAAPPAQP